MSGLPGKLVRTDWKGFAANRNEAFREAESLGFENQYLFMLDADDSFSPESGFAWPDPICDGYRVRVMHGSESQGRVHLFRGGAGWAHERIVHEYSSLPGVRDTQRGSGMKPIHEETMCCGYKKCPSVKVFDDGSVELTDDDVEAGSIGTIKLRPETAARLVELLSKKNG